VKVHWQKHCEQVSEAKVAEQEQIRDDILAKLESGELDVADIDESLRTLFTIGYHEIAGALQARREDGHHARPLDKCGDTLTRRRHNEKTEQLFDALGGAIAHAMGGSEARRAAARRRDCRRLG
jgi:hypothetical protein